MKFLYAFLLLVSIHLPEKNPNIVPLQAPTELSCENAKNPAVIDARLPRLSWINTAPIDARRKSQTAYQVRAGSSLEKLSEADIWDSGKVLSGASHLVKYAGRSLESRQECWWQVRVWDEGDRVSAWSEPAFWRMGFLDQSDWEASWIGVPWQGEAPLPKPPGGPNALPVEYPPPAPLLRKEFKVGKPVKKAVVFTTGLGYFELYLNGQKVGDDVLVPNQTNYGKRPDLIDQNIPLPDDFTEYHVMYLAYDITKSLQQESNVIGAILGNGFYNAPKYWAGSYGSPRFIAQVHINYEDGSEEVIITDPSWKVSKSAIMMDLVYHGEHYDARKEQPGWSTPGFDDSGWEDAAPRNAPYGKMTAHTAHTDKVTRHIEPVSIIEVDKGKYRVDFGVEISGWLRLNGVSAPAGHKIDIKYLSDQYSGDNSYIFSGKGPESYHARFNWFVFKEVEISNWQGNLEKENLTALMINTQIDETATFVTSNPLFNEINKIWKQSQLDNMHGGIASDCPHRERAAYTGDGQVACVTVMHNFDARNFYEKWIRDIRGAQVRSTGYVPNGAPWQPGCGGGVAWGAAIHIMPWEYYLHYGDLDMLKDNYEAMKGYIKYMESWVDENGIMFSQATGKNGKPLRWLNLGEWSWPSNSTKVPDDMVHTFYFWRCSDITSKVAQILGLEEDAAYYKSLTMRTMMAFHNRFYQADSATYGKGGGNIFALAMGVPDDRYQKVVNTLKNDIKENEGHLDTGIFGTQFFFEVLSENGLHELAYAAMNKTTQPSYGHWLEQGATTTREDWDSSGSHNHPMFGGGLVWFYRKLAGIQTDREKPGYRHIIFKPLPIQELTFTRYSNKTPFGLTGIEWVQENGTFEMTVDVPVGSTATVFIPGDDKQNILESGNPARQSGDISFRGWEEGYHVLNIGSGHYQFLVQ